MTQSLEDYLETIGNLNAQNSNPRVKDIAVIQNVSKPSVHTALHQLEDRGMITHKHYGAITMTEKGIERYKEIKHKHDTLCRYLVSILGVSRENAEKDACEMEHRMSDEAFLKFEEAVKKL